MQETVDYARNLGADWCSFLIAVPLVGSEMYDQFVHSGCIGENFFLEHDIVYKERQFNTPEISAADLNEFAYSANLDINFLNNINKVSGLYKDAIELYRDMVDSYPFHIIGWYCMMECYDLLGERERAEQVRDKISTLVKTDERVNKMFTIYNDLMQNFSLNSQSLL